MTKQEQDIQRLRIEVARKMVRVWMQEAIDDRERLMNQASRANSRIAVWELRLQEYDAAEAKLNREAKKKP